MKYQTIVFDVNKPTLKQVKVPLESDYGVAVKCLKDGQYVEDATFTLDGEQPSDVHNGWSLFQLSADSEQVAQCLTLEVSQEPSLSASVSATLEHTTPVSSDTRITMNATVDGVSENIDIESPFWLTRPEVKIVFTSQGGSVVERKLTSVDQLYITNARGVTTATWNAATATWELSPTIKVLYPSSKMRLNLMVPANSTVEAEAVVKVDSGDGIDSKFSIVVQEQELGYVEID